MKDYYPGNNVSITNLLESHERRAVKDAIVTAAEITTYSEVGATGMYTAKQPRIEKVALFDDVTLQTGMGILAVRQAMYELRLLNHISFTDVHEAFIHIQASLPQNGYNEDNSGIVFRYANTKTRQYHNDGDASAAKEVRDQYQMYEDLRQAGRINRTPTIPRHVGQFIPTHRLKRLYTDGKLD